MKNNINLYFSFYKKKLEKSSEMMKKKKINTYSLKRVNNHKSRSALCLLTYQPTESLITLFASLENPNGKYDFYVVVDDHHFKIDDLKQNFPKIKWITIEEEECKRLGYQNINFVIKNGEPSAWDKAFCYFCEKTNESYHQYWFMEDDVFIPKTNNIVKMDNKYREEDVLLKIKKTNQKNFEKPQMVELKKYLNPEYEKSLCKSMICIVRLSNRMMKIIKEYVNRNKTMFFLEYFVCTLANHHHLNTKVIDEMSTIIWRKIWKLDEIMEHEDYVYHPIKNVELQRAYRRFFEQNEHLFLLNHDLKEKIMKMKKVSTNFSQIILFKKGDQRMKVTTECSKTDRIIHHDYIDYCKIYSEKRVFYYRFNIPSIKDACSYMHVQGYEYDSFYMMIEEIYEYNGVYVKITNIPTLHEFMKIESDSKEKLEDVYRIFNIKIEDSKRMTEIIKESKVHSINRLIFENVMKNHRKDQYDLYEKVKSSMGNSLKIYDEKEVKAWI